MTTTRIAKMLDDANTYARAGYSLPETRDFLRMSFGADMVSANAAGIARYHGHGADDMARANARGRA